MDLVMAAGLQNVYKALNVALHVDLRIDERIAHTRLSREIDDGLEAVLAEHLRNTGSIGEVDPDKRETGHRLELVQPRPFQIYVVVLVEIVEANYRPATLQQRASKVEADEARGTGDKNWSHVAARLASFLFWPLRRTNASKENKPG